MGTRGGGGGEPKMADTATGTKEGTKEVAKGDGISVKAKIPAGFIAFGSFAVFACSGGWAHVKRFSEDADNGTSIKLFLLITYLALLRIAYWVTFIDKKKAPETTGSIVAMARWVAWNTLTHAFILFPTAVAISIAYFPAPAWQDIAIGALVHFVLTCFSMSVMLHRYFSHAAYKANRGVTILLAAAACLAYQYGPIWWSSKHRRHHKECDKPKDPHSWANYGLGYAWIGWTMHPHEQHIDMEYVHRNFKYGNKNDGKVRSELKVIDDFFFVPTWLMHAFLIFGLGIPLHTVCYRYTMPTALCSIATLWFNCKVHHKHPRRAKRPGPDLGYFLMILPLQTLGILG